MKFESFLEERFYENILINYEIYSLVKRIDTRYWIENKRYDFVLVLYNNHKILIECDGAGWHSNHYATVNDWYKELLAEKHDCCILRFTFKEIMFKPEYVANKIQGQIELFNGDVGLSDGYPEQKIDKELYKI